MVAEAVIEMNHGMRADNIVRLKRAGIATAVQRPDAGPLFGRIKDTCVPYYDVEIYYDDVAKGMQNEQTDLNTAIDRLKPLFSEDAQYYLSRASRMHQGRWKNSFHIVVRDGKRYADGANIEFPENNLHRGQKLFDESVYKAAGKRQLWRLPYQAKPTDDNPELTKFVPVDQHLQVRTNISDDEFLEHVPNYITTEELVEASNPVKGTRSKKGAAPVSVKKNKAAAPARRTAPVRSVSTDACTVCGHDHAALSEVFDVLEDMTVEYEDWSKVMFCIANICGENIDCRVKLAHEFSSICEEKYDQYAVEEFALQITPRQTTDSDALGIDWLRKRYIERQPPADHVGHAFFGSYEQPMERLVQPTQQPTEQPTQQSAEKKCSCLIAHKDMKRVIREIGKDERLEGNSQSRAEVAAAVTALTPMCSVKFLRQLTDTVGEPFAAAVKVDCGKACDILLLRIPKKSKRERAIQARDLIKRIATVALGNLSKNAGAFDSSYTFESFIRATNERKFASFGCLASYIVAHAPRCIAKIIQGELMVLNYGADDISIVSNYKHTFRYIQRTEDVVETRHVGLRYMLYDCEDVVPHLKVYNRLTFVPAPGECSPNDFNAAPPMQATRVVGSNLDFSPIQPILNHIRLCFADESEECYEWLLAVLHQMLARPDVKTQVVPILYGREGCGKGVFIEKFLIPFVYGKRLAITTTGITSIVQRFNSLVMNKLFICCNEVSSNGSAVDYFDGKERMKSLITDPTMTVEKKGVDMGNSYPNYLNFWFLTNNATCCSITETDRRYVPMTCSDRFCGNYDYFDNLVGCFTQENADLFYTYICNLPSKNVRCFPKTDIRELMILNSLPVAHVFLRELEKSENAVTQPASRNDNYDSWELHLATRQCRSNEYKYRVTRKDLYVAFSIWANESSERRLKQRSFSTSVIQYLTQRGAKNIDNARIRHGGNRYKAFDLEVLFK